MITIHFFLKYKSTYGQTFFVSGNIPGLGNGSSAAALPIHYLNDEYWYGSVDVPAATGKFSYQYILRNADGFETIEWGNDRFIDPSQTRHNEIQVADTWNYAGEYENAFLTKPFTETLFKAKRPKSAPRLSKNTTHVFRVKAPLLQQDEVVCLVGSDALLGAWNGADSLKMTREGNWFVLMLDLQHLNFPVWYKYGVWNTATGAFVRFEDGPNRLLHGIGKRQLTFLHDGFVALPNQGFRGAGVAIPVFSLKTSNSYGVGEFSDIKTLVDWARQTGMKLIQLLPVNDTTSTHTWQDSYPYAPISVFALHPLYLNIEMVAGKKHAALIKAFKHHQPVINALPQMDYEQVMLAKLGAARDLFAAMKQDWLEDEDYLAFFEENKHWLLPYAAFCHLRDKNGTADFKTWESHGIYNEKAIEKLFNPKSKHYDAVAIHLFMQYHLHVQLKDAVQYAHRHGLIMKGDLPIGIYRYSCDAWMQPKLYNMEAQAGAPPDDFAVKGQNWGFPTYNWKNMQADGFAWWKQRFEQMSRYFDAFRIDHILGFFRIWSIPLDAVEGILGHFVPAIPVFGSELSDQGIWFNKERFCQPLITDEIIETLFGGHSEWVKDHFLESRGWGNFCLKPEFNTQRKVEAWFASGVNAAAEPWMEGRLFDLISNVILIEDEQLPGAYHFRIGAENTLSFQKLDADVQHKLRALYLDYYFRRQDNFWRKQAMQKLPALKAATNMLVCGEDLGMVPDCVPGVMRNLGLLSLEIQRMPKDPKTPFFNPAHAPYLSVVTPSTHDMSTIRGWWEENPALTRQFYNQELGQYGNAPFYCEAWINKAIIAQHVYSPAMWSIFQLQDLIGIDAELRLPNPHAERINQPSNPKHYWRYRMHLTLEELLTKDSFNREISQLLSDSGRA